MQYYPMHASGISRLQRDKRSFKFQKFAHYCKNTQHFSAAATITTNILDFCLTRNFYEVTL